LAIVFTFMLTRSAEGLEFAERDWIVIADLDNQTEDDVFDRSLNTALTVAVSQSRYVNVYPRSRVSETLRRMGKDSVTVVDQDLAREVAMRENLRAVLAFEITSLAETYMLTTRVLAPETGVAVYSETARARGKDEVLGAVDELARRLRSNLGESLLNISQRSVPLPQATTSSLVALKLYSDGSVAWSASRWEEARALWGAAVALDSTFAWVHASLGLAANWLDETGSGQPHFDRALALLDRVTERERLWIRSLIEEGEPMVETLRVFTQLYPDDRSGWYNLGNGLRALQRFEEALEAYDRVLAVDSLSSWAYTDCALTYDDLGRYEEAARSFADAFRLDPPARSQIRGDLNRISGFVLAKVGDTVGARETFELVLSRGPDDRANGLRSLALLDLYQGRAGSAVERLREAVRLSESTGARLSEFRNRLYLASAYGLRGMESAARDQREIAETIVRQIGADPFWLVILAKELARAGEVERAAAVLDLLTSRPGVESDSQYQGRVDQIRGEVALARGDFDAARVALERARATVRMPGTLESVAHGYAAGGRHEDAAAALESVLGLKPLGYEEQGYWLAAHVELGRVYEALGNDERAAVWYGELIELWLDGDPDLPLLLEVKERLEALGG
jgi:tetratricopeptide (TPR) repeat protein